MNRLQVSEEGSTARCELVGLNPFNSALTTLSYENALAMELAIRHLNEGNGSLVPELTDLPKFCPITFSASFVDTRRNSQHAFSIVDDLTTPPCLADQATPPTALITSNSTTPQSTATSETTSGLPCAFVGSIDSAVSRTTALVTGLRGFPQISSGSTSSSLSNSNEYPFFGRTCPDDSFMAEIFVRFLYHTVGTRHFFVIFESHPYTESILNSLRDAIRNLGLAPTTEDGDEETFMYLEERLVPSDSPEVFSEVVDALENSKLRMVVNLMRTPEMSDALMITAYERGMAGGDSDYHWWFFSLSSVLNGRRFPKDADLAKAYNGTGDLIQDFDKTVWNYEKFLKQSFELKQELYNQHDNTGDGKSWLFAPGAPFLNESQWLTEGGDFAFSTAEYTYDATVLLGLSACNAISGASLFLTGTDYFETIKQTNFTGISGEIILDQQTGTRLGDSVQYKMNNWLGYEDDEDDSIMFQPYTTYIYAPGSDDNWEELSPHIFSSGKTLQELGPNSGILPVVMKYKEVKRWLIVFSALCSVCIVMTSIACAIWAIRNKNSRVVRASQPFFLLLLCFGIALLGCSIIPISLEHLHFFAHSQSVCNSYVALLAIGFGITMSTLLAKTYRINRIMNSSKGFRRIKLSVSDTIYPVAIILVFNIIMLSVMIKFAPIVHEEKATDWDKFHRPIEMYATCVVGRANMPYYITIIVANIAVLCVALFQTWRARHLSTEFAESKYIANALLIAIIVSMLSFPVLRIVRDSPVADTFINVFAITIMSGTLIGFIFIPKMRMLRKSKDEKKKKKSWFNSSPGERIVTTKPQQQLAAEIKTMKRELARVRKEQQSLELQNASLQDLIKELKNDRGDDNGTSDPTSSNGSVLSSRASGSKGGTMLTVMEDEDCSSKDCSSKYFNEAESTMPFNLEDSENAEFSDSESSDGEIDDSVPKVQSLENSKGSLRRMFKTLSGKLRSDRGLGTSHGKQSVSFSISAEEN